MPRDTPAVSTPSVYNIANMLTVLRLVMVPMFAYCLARSDFSAPDWRMAATVVFLVASATDFVDGWLARRFGLITAFGKIADPIADKALVGTALVMMSVWAVLPWWVTVVILARELGVTVLRLWVIRIGVIAAGRGGKAKTVLQVAAIAWYVWPWPPALATVGPWLMTAAVAATMITGADYLVQILAMRSRARRTANRL